MIYMWTTYKSVDRVRTYKSITSQLTIFSRLHLQVQTSFALFAPFVLSTSLIPSIRTIVTIGRSMLHHANLDKCFWGEAAMAAIYIKNRLPSPKIASKTPFEIVYKSKPSVKHIRVFGCRTYVLTPKEKRCKWDAKARVCVFMGYEEVSKAYRVYDIEAGQVVISRDVTFDESTFGFSTVSASDDDEDVALDLDSLDIGDDNVGPTTYQQTGKRKNHSRGVGSTPANTHSVTRGAGLEESSAPENTFQRQVRYRPSMQAGPDFNEEVKEAHEDEDGTSTPPAFWRASVNAVEASDLSEPATFQDAVNGPHQVHWRKAINAKLESMRLRGKFQDATFQEANKLLEPSGYSRSSENHMNKLRSARR